MTPPLHIFTSDPAAELAALLAGMDYDRTFVLMPASCSRVLRRVVPALVPDVEIDDRESEKNFRTLQEILSAMFAKGLTRRSIVICVGGGVTTDIGGFAAAIYMRGIRYINIPTTLLAMVDASSGGKTAIDFRGIKNCVGAFHTPLTTIISPQFLSSLPACQLLSGWGEMLKHALLKGDTGMFGSSPDELLDADRLELIRQSVEFKQSIVEQDPKEAGLRKILNLGHTAGHAFEMLAIGRGREVTHGQAVAQGLVTALVLSVLKSGYPSLRMQTLVNSIHCIMPPIAFDCKDYPELLAMMHRDKKNQGDGKISFTLLDDSGSLITDFGISDSDVREALDITRDLLGI